MSTHISGDTGVSQCQPNSVSQDDLQSGVAGKGPAFSAYQSVAQNLGDGVPLTLNFQSEEFDTANCFDTTLNRFQPNVAGYYLITGRFTLVAGAGINDMLIALYKNGTSFKDGHRTNVVAMPRLNSVEITALVFLNGTTDFVTLVAYVAGGATVVAIGASATYFQGFLARSAT